MLTFILLLTFICVAVGLAWFLISRDRGEKEPVWALWLAVGFGVAGGFLASYFENLWIPITSLLPGASQTEILAAVLAIGVIEEACKFVPLALVIYKRPFFNERTDGVIYFALAGLGFGLPENLLYTLHLGPEAGFIRLIMTPLFHAAATGIVGYLLVKRKLTGRSPLGIWLPLAGMMLLHGLYNFGIISGSPFYALGSVLITAGLSVTLFTVFARARREDGMTPVPAANLPAPGGDGKALLSLLFGTVALLGVLFMALISLGLGVAGVILGTMSRSSSKRGVSTAGLVLSCLAILASLAVLAYAVTQDPSF